MTRTAREVLSSLIYSSSTRHDEKILIDWREEVRTEALEEILKYIRGEAPHGTEWSAAFARELEWYFSRSGKEPEGRDE